MLLWDQLNATETWTRAHTNRRLPDAPFLPALLRARAREDYGVYALLACSLLVLVCTRTVEGAGGVALGF